MLRKLESELFFVVKNNELERSEEPLQERLDLNTTNEEAKTLLQLAIENGYEADVNVASNNEIISSFSSMGARRESIVGESQIPREPWYMRRQEGRAGTRSQEAHERRRALTSEVGNASRDQAIVGTAVRRTELPVSLTNFRITTTGIFREHSGSIDTSKIPERLQSYINDFKGKEPYEAAFNRLKIDLEKYSFLNISCIISQNIPNIPVSLNSHLYDWNFLKKHIEQNGCIDPMTRELFTLGQVMPDRTTRDNLEGIITHEKEIYKIEAATCANPIFKR